MLINNIWRIEAIQLRDDICAIYNQVFQAAKLESVFRSKLKRSHEISDPNSRYAECNTYSIIYNIWMENHIL